MGFTVEICGSGSFCLTQWNDGYYGAIRPVVNYLLESAQMHSRWSEVLSANECTQIRSRCLSNAIGKSDLLKNRVGLHFPALFLARRVHMLQYFSSFYVFSGRGICCQGHRVCCLWSLGYAVWKLMFHSLCRQRQVVGKLNKFSQLGLLMALKREANVRVKARFG